MPIHVIRPRLVLVALVAALAWFPSPAHARQAGPVTLDEAVPPGSNYDKAEFRLWIPADTPRARGVLVLVPGSNGDGRPMAEDAFWQDFAGRHKLAIVACRFTDKPHDLGFIEDYVNVSKGSGQALMTAMSAFAAKSSHPEVATAPIMLWGMSAGGQFNYEFAAWKPERVLAFVVNKGGIYYSALVPAAARSVPALLFVGDKDLAFRTNTIVGLFAVNRRAGALWALVTEPGTAHAVGRSREMGAMFFEDVMAMRLSDAGLRPVPDKAGFIGDLTAATFQPVATSPAPTVPTAWLPTERIAKVWQDVSRGAAPSSAGPPPPWAYTLNTPRVPGAAPPAPDANPKQVPGSALSLTLAQTRNAFDPPDWHPSAHPPMPEAVAHGRRPEMRACGFCHLVNGQGRPENASLAGLPAAYIIQQTLDFKNGDRRSSEPKMGPPNAMIQDAKAATMAEVASAAEYFSSFPFKKWVRVVEARDVPKSQVSGWMHVPTNDGTEQLGQRIIEMPEDLARTELRDASSGFVAYVPPGSIARGEALVKTGGGGRTVACATCHGADLRGLGPVPPLAGRSPSYTVRQLFDMQQGVRKGPWSALMTSAVARLTVDDMIAIAAYTASREP